jgi:hypothetical protein
MEVATARGTRKQENADLQHKYANKYQLKSPAA